MRRLFSISGFALLLALSGGSALQAGITCSAAEFNGTFAFYTTGSLLKLPPEGAALVGPFAQSGTFTMDGQGNVTIESTASYNGLIQNAPAVTTYTVAPDCTVTFNLTLPFPLSVPSVFSSVLSSGMRQNVVMITEPPGTLVVGHHVKQDTRFCGTGEFLGAYQIDMSGAVAAPRERAGVFQRIGRLEADGEGKFKASTIANYAGNIVKEDFEGTYEVNAKCFVTLSYTNGSGSSAQQITINGPLGGHGETAMVMVTSPGWAVSGTLRSQQ